jgi:hypothetical protein
MFNEMENSEMKKDSGFADENFVSTFLTAEEISFLPEKSHSMIKSHLIKWFIFFSFGLFYTRSMV